MSQTGYTPIQLYYSTTASTAPTAGNLASGELAINITDGKLFYKDNAGVVQTLATKAATSGTYTSITLSGGTANGVAYLNGSKVVTTGSALAFDGTYLTANGLRLAGADVTNTIYQATGALGLSTGSASGITFATNLTQRYSIDGTGVSAWSVGGSEQMRLTSTGLGIGTSSPANKLDVLSTAFAIARFSRSGAGGSAGIDIVEGSGGYSRLATPGGTSNMSFRPGGTELMLLDSSGNLGLGVTPSAWSTSYKAYQVGYGSLWTATSSPTFVSVSANSFYSSGGYAYSTTGVASDYYQNAGSHVWRTAASGTAGTAITFTQAMTLDASGNLGIGTTSPARPLEVLRGTAGFVSRRGYSSGQSLYEYTDATAAYISTGSNLYNAFGINETSSYLNFYTANAERARIDSSGNLGIGTTSPNASAILDAQSTTKGVRFPNMTTTQKNAISSPAAGLVVFDTTLAKLCVYSGSAWQTITSI